MADSEELKKAMMSYAERLRMVRRLSAPSVEEVNNADDYCRLLLANFRRIGELAADNETMLRDILMPVLKSEEALSEEEAENLDALNELLIDDRHSEVLDIHLAEMINTRLSGPEENLSVDEALDDLDQKVHILDRRIDVAYERMGNSLRANNLEEAARIRKSGIADHTEMMRFLEKDVFVQLSPEARDTVLTAVRYGANLYEQEDPRGMVVLLKNLREQFRDPFYHELSPDSDWDKHDFMLCEYIAELCYGENLPAEVYKACYEAICECERLLEKPGGERLADFFGAVFLKCIGLCAAIMTSDPSVNRRLEEVIQLYEERDIFDYSRKGTNENLANPAMILHVIDMVRTSKEYVLPESVLELQRRIPYDVMYYYSMARVGDMSIPFINHLDNFMGDFREIPGGIRCGELCLRTLVAIHPPTYIHSNMVAKFSLCMTRHLLYLHPELFTSFPGCGSVEEVEKNSDRILDYVYNAALYHDIGKLTIIDVIAMYGRRLLDTEFLELKKHPDNGAELALIHESLRNYADVIRGHHLWYDGSRGYPMDFDPSASPYKTIIDIVTVADCLDAATDRVGRSYSRGKTPEELTEEIKAGAGTRYAPFMAELLENTVVAADIRYLLDEGRSKLYRDTFNLLMELFGKGRKVKTES